MAKLKNIQGSLEDLTNYLTSVAKPCDELSKKALKKIEDRRKGVEYAKKRIRTKLS